DRSPRFRKIADELDDHFLLASGTPEIKALKENALDLIRELKANKIRPNDAYQELTNILNKLKDIVGGEKTWEFILSSYKSPKLIKNIPVRGIKGPPLLDMLFFDEATKVFIIVEAKGG